MRTDSSGNVADQRGHFPFGELWYTTTSGTPAQVFTTYFRDGESGNDYALHRTYVDSVSRFSSIDSVPGTIDNPQSQNRYSYVLNDPVNSNDPTGLFLNGNGGSSGGVPDGCFVVATVGGTTYYACIGQPWLGPPGGSFWCYFAGMCNSGSSGNGSLAGGGGAGASVNLSSLAPQLKKLFCSKLPDAGVLGVNGSIGGVSGDFGSLEMVINYNTGQVSLFAAGGVAVGLNGGAQGNVFSGFIWGIGNDNSKYSRGFSTISGGWGFGGYVSASSNGFSDFRASSPGAWRKLVEMVKPNGNVFVAGASMGASIIPWPNAQVTVTNYSKPLNLSPLMSAAVLVQPDMQNQLAMVALKSWCKQ